MLLDPLPLGLPVVAARKLADHGRSHWLAKSKGQGLRPCTPAIQRGKSRSTRSSLARRQAAPHVCCGCMCFCFATKSMKLSMQPLRAKIDIPFSGEGSRRFSKKWKLRDQRPLDVLAEFYLFPPFAMEATQPATTANKPLKVFRLGDLSASVFANDREIKGKTVTFYNVTLSKLYKKGDEFLRTTSFGEDDLNPLCYLINNAETFIRNELDD
jgi:hypothetical protein